ncbi:hypothetical protein GCM10027275_22240 [Rhabdobacter roseus]|uniref:histidine kinase n=1 Tax=Rhabdobacter roseus TaxID=1655419 RepID=A0A840TWY9_9BACT|nr:ATP-binding protein [Rhabdobacter roseus]MBB5284159.1 PAS domain S-box-containing protein [Rhabdobacter roseus]
MTREFFLQDGWETSFVPHAYDWASTPLGEPAHWPQSLKTALARMLGSDQPMALAWGTDLILFYNDACQSVIGTQPALWEQLSPGMERVRDTGIPASITAQPVLLNRQGFPEECYFTLSFSPIPVDDGTRTGGVYCTFHETTRQVLSQRRFGTLAAVARVDASMLPTAEAVGARLMDVLSKNPQDFPFLILYSQPDPVSPARLLAHSGFADKNHAALPETIPLRSDSGTWPLSEVFGMNGKSLLFDLPPELTVLPPGPVPSRALLLPLLVPDQPQALGCLIAGINPRLALDEEYRLFLDMAARPIAAALGRLKTLEEKPKNIVENDQLIRTLIMQAPVAMGIYRGADFIIEVANNKLLEFWGQSAYQVMNKPLFEVLPELKEQGVEAILKKVFTTGQRFFGSEYNLHLSRRKKTEEVFVSFALEPLYDDAGNVTAIMAVSNEVTDLVKAKKEVEESEARQKLAIEAAEMGTYDLNMITDELIYSDRFARIFGMDPTQPLNRNDFRNRVHPDDQAARTKAHEEALKTGMLLYEARILWPDHTSHWVRLNGKIVFDANQVPIRMHGTAMDINEQKMQSDRLEKMVEERTRELKEINILLKKSNHELEQFAYIASHDLQEPLRKIQTFADIIQQNVTHSGTAMKYLPKINDSARRMEELIRSVLNYSRLSMNGQSFEYTDLNQVLENIRDNFELQILEKRAVIQSDPLPVVKGIPLQLNQLFSNLIGNALKFSQKEPFIRITARFLSAAQIRIPTDAQPDDKYLELVFRDNGIGFDAQYADQIFTIFQRLHDKQTYAGTGIGLALCKKIVENHHGYILAQSEEGSGATFYIYLPLL